MADFSGYDILTYGFADRDELNASGMAFAAPSPGEKRNHEVIDPRPYIRVENQGRIGACVGHGVSTAAECVAGFQKGSFAEIPQLSRWFAYRMGQRVWGHEGIDQGCTIAAGVESAKRYGLPPETLCPYPAAYNMSPISQAAFDAATKWKIKTHSPLGNANEVVGFLDGGYGAVVIGVLMTRAMSACRGTLGVNEVREDGSKSGHAMSFCGFIEMNGVLKLILANSWDKTWGVGGYALVSLEAVDYLAQRPYTALVGVSDLTGFDRVRVLKSFSGVG